MNDYKSYFLEKAFELRDSKLVEDRAFVPIVRPCMSSYKTCLAAMRNNNGLLELKGCIAAFNPSKPQSLEEWLVELGASHGIVPDFEEHLLIDRADEYKTYILKVIDLHTGKVLEDNIEMLLNQLN